MRFLDDILFVIGFLLVVIPTFVLNMYVGCYFLGVLFLIGAYFSSSKDSKKE